MKKDDKISLSITVILLAFIGLVFMATDYGQEFFDGKASGGIMKGKIENKTYHSGIANPTDEAKRSPVERVIMAPRVRHCWHCGRKLHGNHFAEMVAEGHSRIFHKSCLKDYEQQQREERQIKPLNDRP